MSPHGIGKTVVGLVPMICSAGSAFAQTPLGSGFSYQGQLKLAGGPVTDTADFQFALWDAASDGNLVGAAVDVNGVSVVDGLFTVQLDFGVTSFNGDGRWLQISVASPSGGTLTTLSPRQPLTATPYALSLPALRTDTSGESPNVIGGHSANSVAAGLDGVTIAGGGVDFLPNSVTGGSYGTIGGGKGNTISSSSAGTIGGGDRNAASNDASTVGGGIVNTASGQFATVGGGDGNIAGGASSVVAGGSENAAGGIFAAAGGGRTNTAGGASSVVAGGNTNAAGGDFATVAGGLSNTASGNKATVAGGESNSATTGRATVGGGQSNIAGGQWSTVPGGQMNEATGHYSFAAGRRAKAATEGTFVWADSTDADFVSTADGQFLIRAGGGVGINKNNPATALDVEGTVTATAFAGDGSGLTGIVGDGLGDHTATQDISLNGNWLSGDGDDEGIFVTNGGNVGVGTTAPGARLGVIGDIRVSGKVQSAAGGLELSGGGSGVNVLLDEDGGSNDTFIIYDTGVERFRVDGNTGTVTAPAFVGDGSGLTNVSVAGDNLGNHTATQALDMNSFDINGAGAVSADSFVGDGVGLTGVSATRLDSNSASVQIGNGIQMYTRPSLLDQENAAGGPLVSGGSTWQSFTAGMSGDLAAIAVRRGAPGGNPGSAARVRIYEGEGTSGAVLGTTSIPASYSTGWQMAAFPSPVAIVAGSQYTLALDGTSQLWWVFDNPGTYGGGSAGGNPDWDYAFRTYIASNSGQLSPAIVADTMGNVGIGTSTPAAKLHVEGEIRFGAGQALIPVADTEAMAVVHGHVDTDGTLLENSPGLSVTRVEEGLYQVTYAQNFALSTTINVTPVAAALGDVRIPMITEGVEGHFTVRFWNLNGVSRDSAFHFMVIGGR